MASRFIRKTSTSSSFQSAIKSKFQSSSFEKSATSNSSRFSLPTPSPTPRFSFSRVPSELGCVQSMLPLHSAVATARMTSCLSEASRSCRALSQALGLSVPR